MMYVAVTRAEHRCYMGLVNDSSNSDSALNTALGIPKDSLNDCKSKEPAHASLAQWLDEHVFEIQRNTALAHAAIENPAFDNNTQSNSSAVHVDILPTVLPAYATESLDVIPVFVDAKLTDRAAWVISSFSNLSRFQRGDSAGNYDVSSPNQISLHAIETSSEHRTIDIDSMAEQPSDSSAEALLEKRAKDSTSMRFELEKGADTGNLLHTILEQVDFHSPD